MHRRKLILAVLGLAVVALIAAGTLMYAPHTREGSAPVEIPRGASLGEIGSILAEQDVISSRYLFIIAARLTDKGRRLQSGLYLFPNPLAITNVVDILSEGSHQAYRDVTVREGLTLRQIAKTIDEQAGFPSDSILRLARDRDFIRELGLEVPSLEGYLLPETYRVRYDENARTLLRRMVRSNDDLFDEAALRQMRILRRTRHEIMTMASLVEGETRLPEERARVAGVYYNRLRRGMLLQADPTIQYIIPDGPRRLLYRDLSINSPYNTYMYAGLPPGPVNNPGRQAIRAALQPERHEYVYFVADGTGGHRFSRTLDEHNRAVATYRKSRRR